MTVEHGLYLRRHPGEQPGKVLLFLHGLGDSGRAFATTVRRVELAGWERLVPDLPGYGRSPWPVPPPGLPALADHLAGWLEARVIPPVVLVGHSMGGVLAQILAERHPGRVSMVIDVEGNVCAEDCFLSHQVASRSPESFCREGFTLLQDCVRRDARQDPEIQRYLDSLRRCDPRTFHRHSRDLVKLSEGEDLARRLAALDCPATYIAGVPDGIRARSRRLLDEAGVPVVEISPAGHWPFASNPDDFIAALLDII
jgi:pimeloyl-ACP methyl ester carboxylesterase